MEFCVECANMLYPKEVPEKKALFLGCRHCDYVKPAEDKKIFTRHIKTGTVNAQNIDRQITLDPALPRTRELNCPSCNFNEVVFFASSEENMFLIFMCCQCSHHWMDKQE